MKKHLKKSIALLLCAAALGACFCGTTVVAAEKIYDLPQEYRVAGGHANYDLSAKADEQDFDFYTEFDKPPSVVDEKIVCRSLAEQKIIYNKAIFTEVDISVDIGTINKNGKFDAGIYVGVQSDMSGKLDDITAYNINLERGADKNAYFLKLHCFERMYAGVKAEIGPVVLPMNTVRLRVVIKNGTLYAFVNGESTPRLTYSVGNISGYVGFRSFYSPNTFDNISIIGAANEIDRSGLNELRLKAQAMIDSGTLTADSLEKLSRAIADSETAIAQGDAYETERACDALKAAMAAVIYKCDFEILEKFIAEAQNIIDNGVGKYTRNSFISLGKVLDKCKTLTAESDEDTLSYWAGRLRLRIDELIGYGDGK